MMTPVASASEPQSWQEKQRHDAKTKRMFAVVASNAEQGPCVMEPRCHNNVLLTPPMSRTGQLSSRNHDVKNSPPKIRDQPELSMKADKPEPKTASGTPTDPNLMEAGELDRDRMSQDWSFGSPPMPQAQCGGGSCGYQYRYDSRIIPEKQLDLGARIFLSVTELPFMILWVYFAYWVVIVGMTADNSSWKIWVSAAIASILVGVGLNANAYGAINRKEGKKDWMMVIRFFAIPFGVSSLSGLTSTSPDDFYLTFPKDPTELIFAIGIPAIVVTSMFIVRLAALSWLRVRWSCRVLFLNGTLVPIW